MAQAMTIRPRLTAALALLVAVMQLAAVGTVPEGGRARESARYFCCCAGECHCTADCCNHAPESSDRTPPGPRLGPDTPVLEAPRSCGTWTATVIRGPETQKALVTTAQQGASVPPDPSQRRLLDRGWTRTTQPAAGPSSPRAPPEPVTSA
ncbi:MAG TPA: hypothetical protein VLT32_21135 [Candidatus Sulfomarinibacteraceae bacterium]|nr:hypothetical protein [Candidatus Sulfomarinibacteraceae bacterium]